MDTNIYYYKYQKYKNKYNNEKLYGSTLNELSKHFRSTTSSVKPTVDDKRVPSNATTKSFLNVNQSILHPKPAANTSKPGAKRAPHPHNPKQDTKRTPPST